MIALALAFLAFPLSAHADNVDDLIRQLKTGDDKIRLSAALGLGKLGNPRGLPSMIDAMRDADRNVRAAVAIGLGKLVGSGTPATTKKAALAALSSAAQRDTSDIVRKKAQEAIALINSKGGGGGGGGGGGTIATGGVFVDIGPMAAGEAILKDVMRKTALKTLGRVAASMATSWPGGRAPKKAEIEAKGVHAFHVDGNVVEVKSTGGTVSCKISMLIATYPDKAMFGFLKGGASVQGGSSATDIALSKQDCVTAVVEDMVAKKIVPTIKSKAGAP